VILGYIADSLRHNYNSSKEFLTISAMPTAVHDSLGAFLVHVKERMAVTGFLSEEESSRVRLRTGTDQNLPSDHNRLPVHKKAGVIKQTDASFVVRNRLFPTIVFEVGFNQRYEALVEDCEQWLPRSEGHVKRCFLINITENDRDVLCHAGQDVGAIDAEAGHNKYDDTMTVSALEELYASIKVDEWVGPFVACLEEYRYDSQTRRGVPHGPRIVSCAPFHLPSAPPSSAPADNTSQYRLPDPSRESCTDIGNQSLIFHIQDLLPDMSDNETFRRDTFQLPLEMYIQLLEEARRELAVKRCLSKKPKCPAAHRLDPA
jgi:hypothetical protein